MIALAGFLLFLVFRRSVYELIASKHQGQEKDKTEKHQNTAYDFPGAYYQELFIQCTRLELSWFGVNLICFVLKQPVLLYMKAKLLAQAPKYHRF